MDSGSTSTRRAVSLQGRGWRTGARSTLELAAFPGFPGISFRWRGAVAVPVELGCAIPDGRASGSRFPAGTLGGVEHLFAALGGLGIRSGIEIACDADELPLLGGGAAEFASAIRSLEISAEPSPMVVAQRFEVTIPRKGAGPTEAHYVFEPSDETEISVHIETPLRYVATRARWNGSAKDFEMHIAPARTFVLQSELDALLASGATAHVEPESVVVLGPEAAIASGRAFTPEEPAAHKLLDLIGDFYPHGGPPIGRITASAPGHFYNHAAMRAAIDAGALRPIQKEGR